jgi:hypothetical protein
MRRGSKVAVVAIAVVLALIFFVPVMQVGFVSAPYHCATEASGITGCGTLVLPGHASITYWALGIGGTYGSVNNSGYGLTVGPTPIYPLPQTALTGFGGNVPTNYGVFTAPSSSVQIQVEINATNPAKAVSFTYSVYPSPTSPEVSSVCQKAVNTASNFTDNCPGLTAGDSYEVLVAATNCTYQVSVVP